MGAVNPDYYTQRKVEPIDVIERVCEGIDGRSAWLLGNVLKYALRAGYKNDDPTDDLTKAHNYAHRLATGYWADE